jgi:hypothetical protein
MKTSLLSQVLITTVYVLVSFCGGSAARAELPPPKLLLMDTLREVKKLGVERIGGKSLEEIAQALSEIEISFVSELVFQNLENTEEGVRRGSGYWNRLTKKIYLSEKHMVRMTTQYGRWLLLHEVIEYLDLGDANLNTSALLDAITSLQRIEDRRRSENRNPVLKNPQTLQLAINEVNNARGGGGVSGVDGGGDGRIQGYMKMIYMELICRLDSGRIPPALFSRVYKLTKGLNVEFMDRIPQGDYIFDAGKKVLRIPTEPTVGTNYDFNEVGVFRLVDEMQKVILAP